MLLMPVIPLLKMKFFIQYTVRWNINSPFCPLPYEFYVILLFLHFSGRGICKWSFEDIWEIKEVFQWLIALIIGGNLNWIFSRGYYTTVLSSKQFHIHCLALASQLRFDRFTWVWARTCMFIYRTCEIWWKGCLVCYYSLDIKHVFRFHIRYIYIMDDIDI